MINRIRNFSEFEPIRSDASHASALFLRPPPPPRGRTSVVDSAASDRSLCQSIRNVRTCNWHRHRDVRVCYSSDSCRSLCPSRTWSRTWRTAQRHPYSHIHYEVYDYIQNTVQYLFREKVFIEDCWFVLNILYCIRREPRRWAPAGARRPSLEAAAASG